MTLQKFIPVVVLFLGHGAGWSAPRDYAKDFYAAIRVNDLTTVKALIKSAGVDSHDNRGATPLMYAAAIGSVEAMTLLLDAGADVNAKNDFDATPLIWAAGDPAKCRMLIDRGADVNARSKQGRMPLMLAARRDDNSGLLRLMLAKGAEPDARDGRGNTPLMLAAQTGDVGMIRVLTEQGADVNAANLLGATPLGNAVCSNRLDAVKLLLAKGARPNTAIASLGAVRHGPIAIGNLSPLMAAAPYGSVELIRELLQGGANVNAKDVRGMTPLMLAVASETQDVKVVKLLLDAGADVSVKSAAGETALDWANKYGSLPVIEELKRAGSKAALQHSSLPKVVERTDLDPRKALNQSLTLLQRSSTEYFKESGCAGCHHQILTSIAVRAAHTSGMRVDEGAAREQLTSLKAELESQQELLLQGIDLFGSQVLVPYLFGLAEAGYATDAVIDSAVADLMTLQSADGSWNRGLGISRAPIQESNITRTAQAIRILRQYGPPARQIEIENRIALARAWLLRAKPRMGDEYAMRLAGLWWSDAEKQKIQRAAQSLLAQQRRDGGWAGNPNLASDAYSTGEALFALHESGCVAVHDGAYRRGIEFLLRTQHDDGAWHVRSRAAKVMPYFEGGFPFGDDQWISAAGTAWASIALASAVDDRKMQANSRYSGAPK
jgi:ankyrin repeat protein